MPEYLAPGVYVEETSFRAKTIEGVSTSIAGFVGPTRYGPVGGEPELLTSYADFVRIYGGIDKLVFGSAEQENYMAHAVRAFFDNGGSKLYVTRVYEAQDPKDADSGKAIGGPGSPPGGLIARFPGKSGEMKITFAAKATPKFLMPRSGDPSNYQVKGVEENDVVFVKSIVSGSPAAVESPSVEGFYDVVLDGDDLVLRDDGGNPFNVFPDQHRVYLITVNVRALRPGRFAEEEAWEGFSPSPHPDKRNSLSAYFTENPASRSERLTVPFAIQTTGSMTGAQVARWLLGGSVSEALARFLFTEEEFGSLNEVSSPNIERSNVVELETSYTLSNGDDGNLPLAASFKGRETGLEKTGLETFADIEEISIVAAPGYSFDYRNNSSIINQTTQHLISHCERMRYRIAVLDSPDNQLLSEVRDFRAQFDSKHAALYYPWVTMLDPLDPDGRREIDLPPSGFVAGIYARNDVEHGVHKAPANEVVRGAIGFEVFLNKAQQDVLNPEGINCFRFFEGRGYRLWGARTITSDPEWKYVNLRRYFAYLERSIEKGTQWVVFQNNSEILWANVRRTIDDFLFNEWKSGHLMGEKPQEAYFVRCDRSTMTQNDIDNGRLICLIGVAPVRPAEFVIFRIGQWTADRRS